FTALTYQNRPAEQHSPANIGNRTQPGSQLNHGRTALATGSQIRQSHAAAEAYSIAMAEQSLTDGMAIDGRVGSGKEKIVLTAADDLGGVFRKVGDERQVGDGSGAGPADHNAISAEQQEAANAVNSKHEPRVERRNDDRRRAGLRPHRRGLVKRDVNLSCGGGSAVLRGQTKRAGGHGRGLCSQRMETLASRREPLRVTCNLRETTEQDIRLVIV